MHQVLHICQVCLDECGAGLSTGSSATDDGIVNEARGVELRNEAKLVLLV